MKRLNKFAFRSNCNYLTILLIIVIIVMYCLLNILTPVVLDDCGYTRPGQTFMSVMHDQAHDYMYVNGRFVAHSTVQIVGGIFGKPIFNIMNAIMTALLVILLAYAAKEKEATSVGLFSIVCATGCVWFLYPDQYVTMFMVAGSVNYIWSTVLILLFLIFYSLISDQTRWLKRLFLCLLALLAGSWSEMYSVCLAPAIFIDLIWHKKYRNKQHVVYAVCFFVGAAIVVLAPGNFARFGTEVDGDAGVSMMTRVVNMLVRLLDSPLLWIWGITIGLALWRRYRKVMLDYRYTGILILAIVFSLAFIAVSGASWPRTFWAIYSFSFILLLQEFRHVHIPNWLKIVIGAALLVCIMADFCHEWKTLKVQKAAIDKVIQQTTDNSAVVCWTGTEPSRKSISEDVLSVEPSSWKNTFFNNYYGLDSVCLMPCDVSEWLQEEIKVSDMSKVVMLENHMLFPVDTIDMDRDFTVEVDMGDVYVFKSRLGRLLDAMHLSCGTRIYRDNEFNKRFASLFSLSHPLSFGVSLGTDENVAFYVTKKGQHYLAVKNSIVTRYKNIDLSNIKLSSK